MTRAFLTKKALSRRTLLRGLGAAVALPLLDSMVPALRSAPAPVTRVAFLYTANGIIMRDWTPSAEGPGFALAPTLKPLEPFRDRVLVLTGLEHHNGESLGDGAGDHARAGATWLTGVHPKKTEGADIHNAIYSRPDSGQGNRHADTSAVAGTGSGRRAHCRRTATRATVAPTATRFPGTRLHRPSLTRPIPARSSSGFSAMAKQPIPPHARYDPARTAAFWISFEPMPAAFPRPWAPRIEAK